MRSFVLLRVGRIDDAREAAELEAELADRLGAPELEAMAAHDRAARGARAGRLSTVRRAVRSWRSRGEAPISRPLARLRRAEALASAGRLTEAEAELRATTLEPVRAERLPGDAGGAGWRACRA